MSDLLDQISKAKARSGGTDLRRLADFSRDKAPKELDSRENLAQRRKFLRDSLGSARESNEVFERILNGNEIQDINYLVRGARAARAVARVAIRDPSGRLTGWGTGFLIAPNVLLTNNHVLPEPTAAVRSEAHFEFELDVDGKALDFVTFALDPARLFLTSPQLDFSVVAVRPRAENGEVTLEGYGWLPLVGTLGKVSEGEWLTIIQHPRGGRKQICIRENQLIKRDPDVLWYSTDTLGGSSGSPVFNNDWYVIALHHSGIPDERDGRIQTHDGRDYDASRDKEEDIRWIANEGVRVSRIVDTLRQALPSHPLLAPIFSATPENARIEAPVASIPQAVVRVPRLARVSSPAPIHPVSMTPVSITPEVAMDMPVRTSESRRIVVSLKIDPDGEVSLLNSSPDAHEAWNGNGSGNGLEASRKKPKKPPAFDVPFNADYDDRQGYDAAFLGAKKDAYHVHLPRLNASLKTKAVKLLAADPFDQKNGFVLKYHNFSVVMHQERRFAIYTAANVDFGGRYELGRPADVWRTDPRIPLETQISNFYYASNQFDRGHLTRREDLEFGDSRRSALVSAADTCHWTNCVPQHSKFNQNKELWQGIERYLLEDSITANEFRAQVFTGPLLDEDDPVWERFKEIQYPSKFWKVVAAINESGKLFATAYLLDQTEVIDQYGIEAAPEVPFGAYKTFQVPITEIERLTGLSFTCGALSSSKSLSEVDPLAIPRRRARVVGGVSRRESVAIDAPENYLPLTTLESIVRD